MRMRQQNTGMPATTPLADQAAGLRSLVEREGLRVLPVFGAGPGVGGGAIAAGLAQELAGASRALLLDQTGEALVPLGLAPGRDLIDLLHGRLEFGEVVQRAGKLRAVNAREGLTRLLEAGQAGADFFGGFLRLADPADMVVMLLDSTSATLPEIVQSGHEVLIVATPRPAALTAGYARIKQLAEASDAGVVFRVLVNGATDEAQAQAVYRSLATTAREFIGVRVRFAGWLPLVPGFPLFGQGQHASNPAGRKALAHIAAAIPTWHLATCTSRHSSADEPYPIQ